MELVIVFLSVLVAAVVLKLVLGARRASAGRRTVAPWLAQHGWSEHRGELREVLGSRIHCLNPTARSRYRQLRWCALAPAGTGPVQVMGRVEVGSPGLGSNEWSFVAGALRRSPAPMHVRFQERGWVREGASERSGPGDWESMEMPPWLSGLQGRGVIALQVSRDGWCVLLAGTDDIERMHAVGQETARVLEGLV